MAYKIDLAVAEHSIAQGKYKSGRPTKFYILILKYADVRYEVLVLDDNEIIARKPVDGHLREAKIQGIKMLLRRSSFVQREDFTMVHYKYDRTGNSWQKDTSQEVDELFHKWTHSAVSIRAILHKIMTNYLPQKREAFGNNDLGQYVRRQVPAELMQLPYVSESIKIQASVGQGVWATVPWIALMDRRITDSTQTGVYAVYLFAEDMQSVYLTLNQGVTEPLKMGKKEGYRILRENVRRIRTLVQLEGMIKDEKLHLGSGRGGDYEVSTVAYYRYELSRMPSDAQLSTDLANVMNNYEQYVERTINQQGEEEVSVTMENMLTNVVVEDTGGLDLSTRDRLQAIKSYILFKGFSYPDHLIENFYLSLKSKPFVILAGVSGTGKTKLVELFAEAIGATRENRRYQLISVRPDWSDPTDLIGYKDLSQQFRPGPLTEVLVMASKPENRSNPYFICLDEMNLARVEHYFSDLLSLLETQKWNGDDIVTSELIAKSSLVLDEDKECYGGLSIPDNVYLIGTVNMDETTHPFSKKVLDRANTIEFNYIQLDQLPELSVSGEQAPDLVPAPNSFLRANYLQLTDVYQAGSPYLPLIRDTTDALVRINIILESIHSHVGFRIRDAIAFYVVYNEQGQLLTKETAFDLQLLQKILPRIQGSQESVRQVLIHLLEITLDIQLPKGELSEDASSLWKDTAVTVSSARYKLSSRKLIYMLRRLEEDGFTSFWLS